MALTADQIGMAIVVASRAFRESAERVPLKKHNTPARWHAIAALVQAFPRESLDTIAYSCGLKGKAQFIPRNLEQGRSNGWIKPTIVDEIVAAVRAIGAKPNQRDLPSAVDSDSLPPFVDPKRHLRRMLAEAAANTAAMQAKANADVGE